MLYDILLLMQLKIHTLNTLITIYFKRLNVSCTFMASTDIALFQHEPEEHHRNNFKQYYIEFKLQTLT